MRTLCGAVPGWWSCRCRPSLSRGIVFVDSSFRFALGLGLGLGPYCIVYALAISVVYISPVLDFSICSTALTSGCCGEGCGWSDGTESWEGCFLSATWHACLVVVVG